LARILLFYLTNNLGETIMSDQSNTTPPVPTGDTPPAPGAKKKRKSPSPINLKYLDEITLIRALVPQAQKADRAATLTAAGWDATRITALSAKTRPEGLAQVLRSNPGPALPCT
jgi:hypothetical protein